MGIDRIYIMIQPAGAMGRFLFPGLPAFALVLTLGLSRLLPRRLAWMASTGLVVGMVEDVRDLTTGLTTPPDFYDLEVGMYVPGQGRLPVIAEDGHWLDKRLLLSRIRVVSGE